MNGTINWHDATGPAFAPGEIWEDVGDHRVSIVRVEKYPGADAHSTHPKDFCVWYEWAEDDTVQCGKKDSWNFQVRYTHIADFIKKRSQ